MFVSYGRGEFGYVNGQIKEAQSNGTICGKCETDTTWFSGVAVDQQMVGDPLPLICKETAVREDAPLLSWMIIKIFSEIVVQVTRTIS